ncbi:MAG TPA: hypothetical protein VGH42_12355 [Verrucomicrobiae bacterium]|jgi:hypothetical protein
MENKTDNEQLLNDVLAEASPAGFREALLGETLRLARRRRHFRQTRQTIGILGAFVLLAILGWQNWPMQPVVSKPLAEKATPENYKLVRTQPLPENAVITTRQFSETQFASSIAPVVQVSTTGGGFRRINDDELLALVSGKPAVLIRTGPHSEELVFANPKDQKGFPMN